MLEGLAAWILRTYVGEYVENLNTDQLSIGYGGIELENLTLKKTALEGFELPLEVRAGFIGHLKLEIPFSRPKSQPWIICIDKLYIIAGPASSSSYDADAKEKLSQQRKQQQLDALEGQWKASREKQGGQWSQSWWPSLYSSFSTTVAENLQLVITDVHFRYEDSSLNIERPFAFGITIGKLAARSTDNNWEAKFLYSEDAIKYKLIELTELAIYWDDDVTIVGELPSKDLEKALHRPAKNDNEVKKHSHVLEPVSGQARMTRNSSKAPLLAKDGPRFDVEFLLDKIPLSLSDVQYSDFLLLMNEMQRRFKAQKYDGLRPKTRIAESPSDWWRFAINCHIEPIRERNRRKTRDFIVQRVADILVYVRAYTEHLTNPTTGPETMAVRKIIEEKMSLDEIRILRSIVTSKITREESLQKAADRTAKLEKEAGASWGSWLTGWTSWGGYEDGKAGQMEVDPDNGQSAKVSFKEPVSEEEQEFLGELAEGGMDDSIFKRDHVFVKLNFKLNSGILRIKTTTLDRGCVPVAELEFSQVTWISDLRPKTNSWQFSTTLGAMFLRDLYNTDTLFPVLIKAQDKQNVAVHKISQMSSNTSDVTSGLGALLADDAVPLLEISFEQRSIGLRDLYRLSVKLQPLTVVYNTDVMTRLTEFFRPSRKSRYRLEVPNVERQLQKMALDRYREFKNLTKAEFRHAVDDLMSGESKKENDCWDVELDMAAPLVILPETFTGRDTSMVIVDLGRISFITAPALHRQKSESIGQCSAHTESGDEDEFLTPCSTPPEEEDLEKIINEVAFSQEIEDMQALKERFYERYKLEFANLQVIVCRANDDWSKLTMKKTSSYHIVDSFTILLNMERRQAFTSDPNWPAVTFSGSLPNLMVHIDEKKIKVLLKCIQQLQEERRPVLILKVALPEYAAQQLPKTPNQSVETKRKEDVSTPHKELSVLHSRARELLVESCLALANFRFDQVSLRLHSRGRCVAELQILGVETEYTRRPYDFSVSFVLHSLLVIDAIQTFGPEYKHLVCSHKAGDISLDKPKAKATSNHDLYEKASNALIQINYQQIESELIASEGKAMRPERVASLNFSSLDIIANQETIVELMNVINAIQWKSPQPSKVKESPTEESPANETEAGNRANQEEEQITEEKKMQVDLSFERVNIILARAMSSTDHSAKQARKVSTVTVADLEFSADIGREQIVKGSLGGLEVLDLTPDNHVHKCILSIGECCQSDAIAGVDLLDASSFDSENKAFSFTFVQPASSKLSADARTSIDVHIASARYVHCVDFLTELSLCAGDFRDYAASVARSIQTAAADAAKEFVNAKRDATSTATNDATVSYIDEIPMFTDDSATTTIDGAIAKTETRISLQLCIETPVIVIPKGVNSPELLVGNLGQISIRNAYIEEPRFKNEEPVTARIDRIFIDINNVSLYSMVLGSSQIRDLAGNSKRTFDFLKQRLSSPDVMCSPIKWPKMDASELETVREDFSMETSNGDVINCVEILQDTGLQLVIDRCIYDQTESGNLSEHVPGVPSFQVEGIINKPMKIALSAKTYSQVLETLNALSPSSKAGSTVQFDQSEAVSREGIVSNESLVLRKKKESKSPVLSPLGRNVMDATDEILFEVGGGEEEMKDNVDMSHTQINVSFEICEVCVVFGAEIRGMEREFASLRLQEFILSYNNLSRPFTEITINLGGLHIEDLLYDGDPAYRFLMKSSESDNRLSKQNFSFMSRLSTSCPEGSSFLCYRDMSSSLPTILTNSPIRQPAHVTTQIRPMMLSQPKFPSQPHLSGRGESLDEDEIEVGSLLSKGREEAWVKVAITLVDDDFQAQDSSEIFVNKYIDVAFNSLDLTVNLQTWVVLFEFFGIGAPPQQQFATSGQTSPSRSTDISEDFEGLPADNEMFVFEEARITGTDIRVSMKSLAATLNKERYPLAKAVVSSLSFDVEQRGSDQKVIGSIGNMSLSDMSPYGRLYRERFVTYGNQALAFTFFRYGEPDPLLKRDLDMKLELKMSSVQYTHTQRFLSEVIAFAQHFLQLQEVLGRMRAASEGNEVFAITNRAARLSLSIDADVPILILPRSATSRDMLVACLGHIVVANSFQYAGSPDTVSGKFTATRFRKNQYEPKAEQKPHSVSQQTSIVEGEDRLLDCMNIGLVDMEVFTAVRTDESTHPNMSFGYQRQGGKLMQETCKVELIVERNLEWAFGRQVPDMTIAGSLSSIFVTLDLAQFGLIMGMLGDNLGEPCEQFERPSSVLIDPLQETNESDAMWTTLSMSLSLVNVTVEMIPRFSFGNIPSKPNAPKQLGRLDFIQSKFVFESFSDGSKSMDLVSHGVLLHDIRGQDGKTANVFTRILEPTEKHSNSSHSKALQFEVHYLDTKDKSHITCLFNRSHIIVVLDFLMETWKFITRREENEFNESNGGRQSPVREELPSQISGDVHLPSGVITKAASVTSKKPDAKTFELKINMTETEIIVVEDCSSKDTAAVILQTTAVLAYRPNHFSERPLTISLQSLEVFSCVLANIDETALSIIDPVTLLIELNSAAKLKSHTLSKGLLGAVQTHPSLEVHFHSQLSLRLSYHDLKLFLRIFESAKKQVDLAIEKPRSESADNEQREQQDSEDQTNIRQVYVTQKPVYTDDSPPLEALLLNDKDVNQTSENQGMALAAVEITGTSLSFCLIDDCGNNDIPLIEIVLNNLYLWHDLEHSGEGTSHATVLADYYNRNVSGWEPCIEPWKCTFHWQKTPKTRKKGERTLVKLHAPERLDLNVTPALLEMINSTKSAWTEDYLNDNSTQSEDSQVAMLDDRQPMTKKRAPFVPFLLRNKTGCALRFGTLTTSPAKAVNNADSGLIRDGRKNSVFESIDTWNEVKPENEAPISFESRSKMRHKGTHTKLKVHQIVVQCNGWQPSTPVTVDKVGDFFRHVAPSEDKTGPLHLLKLQAVRLVFSVSLEGARKVVTVRSSLIIANKTNVPFEIWAENLAENTGQSLPCLRPGGSLPVPVSLVQWSLFIRPRIAGNYDFCKDSIEWRDVTKPHEGRGNLRECQGKQANDVFRFCSFVTREGFPVEKSPSFIETVDKKAFIHPGHVINIVHHLLLVNLLPVELSYVIKDVSTRERIKPGKSMPLHEVDSRNIFEIGFSFESHPRFEYVRISTRYRVEPAIIPIKLQDLHERPIILNLKIEHELSMVKISVFSPYWLVNKTGIPLIFRREGETFDASGQFEEHEKARSLTPLLFSYIEEESMFRCQMRVGKGLNPDQTCLPVWGHSFSLEVVRDHRTLYVRQGSNKPEITFDIGIDSCVGKGQLSCTRIVSFVTKYHLENRSQHTLAFAQRHVVKGKGTTTPDGCIVSLPEAITLFHWPRSDFDPLLCVRLHDIDYCHWSGGFKIDKEGSFHINMRTNENCCFIFLRVEVVLQGATYHVILTDTDDFPPPFRIDNMSQVDVMFWQEKCASSTRSLLKSKHSVSYALHEPSLDAKLTLSVFEEMSETYNMMRLSDDSPRLYYQNAIFIGFGKTFAPYQCMTDDCCHGNFVSLNSNFEDRNLVLDVVDGHRVVLSRKVLHKRSQLWRMNAKGQLLHVGSSSPHDPRQKSPKASKCLVLDIQSNYTEKRGFAHLVLVKSDPQRVLTQTWCLEDGLLKCSLPNMAVRPQDGVNGLREGCAAVLAPLRRQSLSKMPAENCLCKHKLRPGSGALVVRITTDGPTRVIRITDAYDDMMYDDDKDWTLVEKSVNSSQYFTLSAQASPFDPELELNISLAHGIGLSVINSTPEEILFATFNRIQFNYLSNRKNNSIEFVVGNLQIDNQLFGCSYPVLLFPTPSSSKSENTKEQVAIELSICQEKNPFFNIDVYRKFDFSIRKMTILLEDRTLLKLLQFFGYGNGDSDDLKSEDFDIHTNQRLSDVQSQHRSGRKMYFERLVLGESEAKLSLLTVGRLTPDLQKIKKSLHVPIISLEDAIIELSNFRREHLFETTSVIFQQLQRHYSDVIRSQAASVLGSLDILGNPMGLLHDVSTGMEALVKRGNLGGLIVNVAHGLSDTAAKMTGSIADGLWSASMDSRLQESRGWMRAGRGSSSGDHLLAGFKGLGMGVIGGLTSMVTQPIEGANKKGVQGFFTGIGKGIVGTVAKPAAGVLDLASGAAAAVRGSARGKQYTPKPVRLKRNCHDAGGVLPAYSKNMAEGQDVLLKLNEYDVAEWFVASELVRSDREDRMRAIITTDRVYFVIAKGPPSPDAVVLHLDYYDLFNSRALPEGGNNYIELIMCREKNDDSLPSRNPDKRPRVRCDSILIARKVSEKINYLKSLYAERQLTVIKDKLEPT
eukprot:gene15340-16917_t